MTVREAEYQYGVKQMVTSAGDNILSLVERLYGSRDDVYFLVLRKLNQRYDWDNIKTGSLIKFLPKNICDEVYEITD